MTRRLRPQAVALAVVASALAVILTGCSTETPGAPTADPQASAEFRAPGVWPLADDPDLDVEGDTSASASRVAELAVEDTTAFWTKADSPFSPPVALAALDGPDPTRGCLDELEVAVVCTSSALAWNTSALKEIQEVAGDLGIVVVIAHEMGHVVQQSSRRETREREADCLGGVYLRSVIDQTQDPRRFTATKDDVTTAAAKTNEWAAAHFPGDPATAGTTLTERSDALALGLDSSSSATTCQTKYGRR